VGIKAWIAKTPCVDEVRPAHCAGCGAASRPVGSGVELHGHGLLVCQVRGALAVGERPGVFGMRFTKSCSELTQPSPSWCSWQKQTNGSNALPSGAPVA
jgi:hypothetical protein